MENTPEFTPGFVDGKGMGLYYEDGRMTGAVDISGNGLNRSIVISEWTSNFPGQGNSKQALQWLRDQGFSSITANGVGMLDEFDGEQVWDISTQYWAHMSLAGLVDHVLDDDGVELMVSADGSITFKGTSDSQEMGNIEREKSRT